jgi:hypothetical protein
MENTISLPRGETPRKNIQRGSFGQEEDQTAFPLTAADMKGSGGLVASRMQDPDVPEVFLSVEVRNP